MTVTALEVVLPCSSMICFILFRTLILLPQKCESCDPGSKSGPVVCLPLHIELCGFAQDPKTPAQTAKIHPQDAHHQSKDKQTAQNGPKVAHGWNK